MTQSPSVLQSPLLLATDGSDSARVAQALVRPIADFLWHEMRVNNPQAEGLDVLTVVTVQPRVRQRGWRSKNLEPTQAPVTNSIDLTKASTQTTGQTQQDNGLSLEQLTQLVQADFGKDFPVSLLVRQGRPAIEILNCARMIQAGLIAIGHRGTGGVRELLLGSVSTAIARYAPCNVLLARSQSSQEAVSLHHVLLLVDDNVSNALALLRQLAPVGIQTVTLLHVQAPLNASYQVAPFISRTSSQQLSQSLRAAQQEQGEQILQRAARKMAASGVSVQTLLQVGDVGPTLCRIAMEIGVDLIVLGSDARRRSLLSPLQTIRQSRQETTTNSDSQEARPLRNTRLSVTEDYVIHYAPCAVLLCRAIVTVSNSGNTVK